MIDNLIMTVPVWASQLQGRSGAYVTEVVLTLLFFKEVMMCVCFLEPTYANFHFFPLTLQ